MNPSWNSITLLALLLALVSATIPSASAVTPKDFGGKGDVVVLHDGAMSEGSSTFSSNSSRFGAADVGKAIIVGGAGPEGRDLVTTIRALVSPKQVTLAANADTSTTSALTYFGTDDTAAIRSCVFEGTARGGECTISDGVTFLASSVYTKIAPIAAGHNPILKGTIDGHGTIIFAPQGALAPGGNDRLFHISSQESNPMPIASAIAKGATSFTTQDAADAATLSPGDWVLVTERDAAAGDNLFADWMEVSGVEDRVVHVEKPFRMAFPNARPWAGPPHFYGLSFRKVWPVTSNVTIRDITIIVPRILKMPVVNHRSLIGIATRATRGMVISNVKCQDASGNCFTGYMDQGMVFQDNDINGSIYSEFASDSDTTVSGNRFNQLGTSLSLTGPPTTGGLEVDFGTGFSSVTNNVVGPTLQVCLSLFPGVHDLTVKGNTCDLVTFGSGANCIMSRGGYRITVTENTCAGGHGQGKGIDFGDLTQFSAPILTDGNRIFNNTVRGFAAPYACDGGRLRTDSCDRR